MEEHQLQDCDMGKLLHDECHKLHYCRQKGFISFKDFCDEQKELLLWRTGIESLALEDKVCLHHEKVYLTRYINLQKTCVNPFKRHKKTNSRSLRAVDKNTATLLNIKPGQKLCRNCFSTTSELQLQSSSNEPSSVAPASHIQGDTSSSEEFELEQSTRQTLDTSLEAIGCSPLKRVGERDREAYGKRKLDTCRSAMREKVAEVLDVPQTVLSSSNNCDQCDKLLDLLKEKCQISSRREKVKVLTLCPEEWSVRKIASEFGVSRYLANCSKLVRVEKGILGDPECKTRKGIAPEIEDKVINFYQSDEYSRICPGKKDFVSVKISGNRQQMQKRLLLINLKELYVEFVKTTEDKIGFSKFCYLRPKWCVPVTRAGMHSVCVCELHQNAKLALTAIPSKIEYKMLLEKLVCSTQSRDCMLHRCDTCPGTENLHKFLLELFSAEEYDLDDVVSYKQWVHTDRTTLLSVEREVHEFVDELLCKFDELRKHHFIMKSQSAYLKELKETLKPHTAIVLLDFAENYSFIVQDAVQGHHWDNSQATIHPFAIYHKQNEELECYNVAMISDHLKHDTVAVHCFIAKLIPLLKQLIPGLQKVLYFSDGAASQYKNYKNFGNLCFHEQDFDLAAEWHFFATSHGKSPCDGIGGTVKRLVARASLQATLDYHILTPKQVYEWSDKNIQGIKFLYVSAEDIKENEANYRLGERFDAITTISGTRSHHCFIPISQHEIHMKRISYDDTFTRVYMKPNGEDSTPDYSSYQPGKYVACLYDSRWYVGYIAERSEENLDVEVEFMTRKDMTVSWPVDTRRERCWIPFHDIITTIEAPAIQGKRGRTYKIVEADFVRIKALLPNFVP